MTIASLRKRKLNKMHQRVSLNRQRDVDMVPVWQKDSESVHSAHANIPLADMTEGKFLRISSRDMAGYFLLFLYTQATKHAD